MSVSKLENEVLLRFNKNKYRDFLINIYQIDF